MIYKGSCNILMMLKIQLYFTGIHYILKYIKNRKPILEIAIA